MSDSNLLKETLTALEAEGKAPIDVVWVGSREAGKFSWELFEVLADKTYYSGHGGQEVCSDLLIVGGGWWMERGEYDGAEWWEFKSLPPTPDKTVEPKNLFASVGWDTLAELMDNTP